MFFFFPSLQCWEDVEDVKREVAIMESLKGHPFIISIIETFEDTKVGA